MLRRYLISGIEVFNAIGDEYGSCVLAGLVNKQYTIIASFDYEASDKEYPIILDGLLDGEYPACKLVIPIERFKPYQKASIYSVSCDLKFIQCDAKKTFTDYSLLYLIYSDYLKVQANKKAQLTVSDFCTEIKPKLYCIVDKYPTTVKSIVDYIDCLKYNIGKPIKWTVINLSNMFNLLQIKHTGDLPNLIYGDSARLSFALQFSKTIHVVYSVLFNDPPAVIVYFDHIYLTKAISDILTDVALYTEFTKEGCAITFQLANSECPTMNAINNKKVAVISNVCEIHEFFSFLKIYCTVVSYFKPEDCKVDEFDCVLSDTFIDSPNFCSINNYYPKVYVPIVFIKDPVYAKAKVVSLIENGPPKKPKVGVCFLPEIIPILENLGVQGIMCTPGVFPKDITHVVADGLVEFKGPTATLSYQGYSLHSPITEHQLVGFLQLG